MFRFLPVCIAVSATLLAGLGAQAQTPGKQSSFAPFQNERLKRAEDPDFEIPIDDSYRGVSGMWVSESKDRAKALIFPEQVRISCRRDLMTCQELKVVLGQVAGMVLIEDPDETIWQITSWDKTGLLASYGPGPGRALSEKCHRHVLTMSFHSGAVSASDIPTREQGCKMFAGTDTYRLVRGQYYVDTTPGNDVDSSAKDKRAKPAKE